MHLLLDAYPALGTLWWIEVDEALAHDHRDVMIKEMVIALMSAFEATYSRFRDDSLLTQLNTNKVLHNAPDEMIDMIQRSMRYEHMSDGVFSLLVGGVLEQFGYGIQPATSVLPSTLPTMNDVIDISHHDITLDADVRLDFGGIGKAYLIERLAVLLNTHAVERFIINGGGDIVVQSSEAIVVEIEHPEDTSRSIASIPCTGAICTSSPFKRVWKDRNAIDRTHLIHPHRIGADAVQYHESATVVAAGIVDADVFATVVALLGSKRFDDIQRMAPLFHAQVLLCSTTGEVTASPQLQAYIH